MRLALYFLSNRQGSVSVEMALIASAFFFVALPVADVGTRLYTSLELSSAVRTGLQYAIRNPDDSAGIQSVVENNVDGMDTNELAVTASEFCECNGSSQTCGDVCAYGEQTYVQVSATYDQELLMNYPIYGNTLPITRTVSVRIE